MAKASDAARNAAVNAVTALLNGGAKLEIRTGSAPTNTTDGDTGTLLSEHNFSSTAFGSASAGVATANAISADTDVVGGTAQHFRAKADGGAVVLQGTVGTSGADIEFDSVAFVTGGIASITSFTLTQPAGS